MICKWDIRLWKQFFCVDQSLSADTSGHVCGPVDKDFDTCGFRWSYIKISGNKFNEKYRLYQLHKVQISTKDKNTTVTL